MYLENKFRERCKNISPFSDRHIWTDSNAYNWPYVPYEYNSIYPLTLTFHFTHDVFIQNYQLRLEICAFLFPYAVVITQDADEVSHSLPQPIIFTPIQMIWNRAYLETTYNAVRGNVIPSLHNPLAQHGYNCSFILPVRIHVCYAAADDTETHAVN